MLNGRHVMAMAGSHTVVVSCRWPGDVTDALDQVQYSGRQQRHGSSHIPSGNGAASSQPGHTDGYGGASDDEQEDFRMPSSLGAVKES